MDGFIDDAHAAGTDAAENAVLAEPLKAINRGRLVAGALQGFERREQGADALGQFRMAAGVFGDVGSFAGPTATEKLLGERVERVRRTGSVEGGHGAGWSTK